MSGSSETHGRTETMIKNLGLEGRLQARDRGLRHVKIGVNASRGLVLTRVLRVVSWILYVLTLGCARGCRVQGVSSGFASFDYEVRHSLSLYCFIEDILIL